MPGLLRHFATGSQRGHRVDTRQHRRQLRRDLRVGFIQQKMQHRINRRRAYGNERRPRLRLDGLAFRGRQQLDQRVNTPHVTRLAQPADGLDHHLLVRMAKRLQRHRHFGVGQTLRQQRARAALFRAEPFQPTPGLLVVGVEFQHALQTAHGELGLVQHKTEPQESLLIRGVFERGRFQEHAGLGAIVRARCGDAKF